MEKMDLGGTWTLNCLGEETKWEIQVPGTVLSELQKLKQIKDPYDACNEYEVRELFWKDYVFEKEIIFTEQMNQVKKWNLICEGLDTLAEVYVDEVLIAKTKNMHIKYIFEFPKVEGKQKYKLKIIFRSVLQYIEDYKYDEGKEIKYTPCGCIKGNQLIRKSHSMLGWDWGPQLIDAGIYLPIYLMEEQDAKIDDVTIQQKHDKVNEKVYLDIQTKITENSTKQRADKIGITIWNEEDKFIEKKIGKLKETFTFEIANPKLWWPNGYGSQPLYKVTIELMDEQECVLDQQEKKIGLRTLTISRQKDSWGEEFAFMINGIKIFTKGGNYIPEDCMYTNITLQRQEYFVRSCARSGFNCIRIWGGGYYPTDGFYALCDRHGLIVWQDLMFACNVYDVTDEFEQSITEEISYQVKRLKHHACLGLWCGNNEIESAWHHWGDFQLETAYLRADYIKQFEYIIPKILKDLDPHTFYWPSSPSSGGCFDNPDDENRGDVHYWDVWHGQKPFTDYRKHYFRFCSEFGFQSFPSIKTIETFARKDDQNIFSKVMESHQKNDAANGKILYYLSENFKYPNNFNDLIYVTQILQAMAIKAGVEHWRQNRGRCMGSIIWQINDNWPVASWSSIDYFGRWKALQYFAKRFYAQKTSSIRMEGDICHLYVENETLQVQEYEATIQLKNMDMEVLETRTKKGEISSLTSACVLTADFSEFFLKHQYEKEDCYVETQVAFDTSVSTETEVFVPYKYLNLKTAKIEVEIKEKEDFFELFISSNVFAPFLELDFENTDAIFSDNFFTISDKQKKCIILHKNDLTGDRLEGAEDLRNKLKSRTLSETYKK